jgi:hypothetical protein
MTGSHCSTVADYCIQKRYDTFRHSTVSTSLLSSSPRSPCHEHLIMRDMSLTIISRASTTPFLVCSTSHTRRTRDRNLTKSSKHRQDTSRKSIIKEVSGARPSTLVLSGHYSMHDTLFFYHATFVADPLTIISRQCKENPLLMICPPPLPCLPLHFAPSELDD